MAGNSLAEICADTFNEEIQFTEGRAGLKIPVVPEVDQYTSVVHNFLDDLYAFNSPNGSNDGEFSIPPSANKPLVIIRKETHRDEKTTLDQRREEAVRQQKRDEFAVLSREWGHPEYTQGFTAFEILIPSIKKIAKPMVFLRTEVTDRTGFYYKPHWADITYREKRAVELEEKFPNTTELNRFILRQTTRLLK